MKRLIPTLLLALTVSLTPAIAANANSAARKPNVLFIAIDDLRDQGQ